MAFQRGKHDKPPFVMSDEQRALWPDQIAFMISVSGPGGTGTEQQLYFLEQQMLLDSVPPEERKRALASE